MLRGTRVSMRPPLFIVEVLPRVTQAGVCDFKSLMYIAFILVSTQLVVSVDDDCT